jgi:hypothetical protein
LQDNADSNLNKQPRDRTRKLALSGILSALIAGSLMLESVVPTGRGGFYVLAAFMLSIVVLESGVKWGWVSYAVTCAVSFLIVPEKLNILPYVLFFGIYTLLKFHIESLRKTWLEIVLKLAAFNLFLWPSWRILRTFIPASLSEGTGVIIAGIVLQIVFILYDILFTAWIRYYFEKIAPRIRKK